MGECTLWISIHKVPSKFSSFIHPVPPQFAWIPFWWPLSQQCAYAFFYPQIPKNALKKLFCFVPYLRKSLSLTFLFSESHVRADKSGRQCLKHNVSGWTYFWALVGTICFTMGQAKTKLKNVCHRHFSKYFSNNSRIPSNHHKNYAKTLFYSIILH